MRRDIKNHLDAGEDASGVVPQVATGTVTGVGSDLRGYDGAMVVFKTGAVAGSGLFTPKIQESDDSTNGSDGTWNDVAATDQLGTLANTTASAVQRCGYIGTKRWVRPVYTYVSGTSVAICAAIIRGLKAVQPN